jgi:NAD(P)-dependent dehydrogenase (short-subunit alcohol dehydrogenase family)
MAFIFSNKITLITGGASGIGKLMGRELAQRGAELIIWDIIKKSPIRSLGPLKKTVLTSDCPGHFT